MPQTQNPHYDMRLHHYETETLPNDRCSGGGANPTERRLPGAYVLENRSGVYKRQRGFPRWVRRFLFGRPVALFRSQLDL